MEESNSSEPQRCPCGFWGSSKTSGLCSKCYQENIDTSKDALDTPPDLRKPVPQQSTSKRTTMDSSPHSSRTNSESLSKKNSKPDELQLPKGDNPKDLSSFQGSVCENHSDSTVSSSGSSQSELSSDAKSRSNCDIKPPDQESASQSNQSSMEVDKAEDRGTKRDSTDLSEESESSPKKLNLIQKNKKRCYKCSCKMELAHRTIGKCRCGLVFCPLHRLPELHECEFDHKEEGREKAREKMVKPTRHLGTSFRRLDSDS